MQFQKSDAGFNSLVSTFKKKITTWDYFVNWSKVRTNVAEIEKELNLLNVLIGKENFREEAFSLLSTYPETIKAFPSLIASRDSKIEILTDVSNFVYQYYDFNKKQLNEKEINQMIDFLIKSGIGPLLKDKSIKNLVDFVYGVEAGLDSNGRKNRGGTLMEKIVSEFISETNQEIDFNWIEQATAGKLKNEWNIDFKVDKANRIIDFAILRGSQLYFVEVNFYGGGGSKLKATAGEYISMNKFWNEQGIKFIWITDGAGWHTTLKALREYYDKSDYLVNLEMLKNGFLKNLLKG
ncbi:type II restriction endonuclease [Hyphobacterium sp. CCMP332]|nr:type II restriction endonuclease [Hyphobacterium sp. CCMP332]